MGEGGEEPQIPQEQNSKIPTRKFDDVDSLFDGIDKFNSKFSIGSMMASSIMESLENPEPIDSSETQVANGQNLASSTNDHQEMSISALRLIHDPTLQKLGLSLELAQGKTATMFVDGEQVGNGEIRLNVADPNKLLGFLRELQPEDIAKGKLGNHLTYLTSVLSKQIADTFDLSEPTDEALQLFGSMNGIINEYQRLGLSTAVDRLKIYFQHAQTGDLKEFLSVEKKGLLQKTGEGFGPADWQKDSTPEKLRQRWTEAISILSEMSNNPKAAELRIQLRTHLLESVDTAIENLQTLEYFDTERKNQLRKELEDAKSSLQTLQN